jgi:hypothetical protein
VVASQGVCDEYIACRRQSAPPQDDKRGSVVLAFRKSNFVNFFTDGLV